MHTAKCATLVGRDRMDRLAYVIDGRASRTEQSCGRAVASVKFRVARINVTLHSHGDRAPARAKPLAPLLARRSQPDEKTQWFRDAPRLRSKNLAHRALGALQRHTLLGQRRLVGRDDAIPRFDRLHQYALRVVRDREFGTALCFGSGGRSFRFGKHRFRLIVSSGARETSCQGCRQAHDPMVTATWVVPFA